MSPVEFLAGYVGGLFALERKLARARADELLERVGLADSARRRIAGFSRGMRQRLGLAQALMNRPRVLLLDEPVSALDPAGRRDMLEWIGALKSETTVFMSTHILDDVERICDTIGILNRGRLVTVEPRQSLLTRYAVPAVEVEFDAPSSQIAAWAEAVRSEAGVVETKVSGSVATVRLESVEACASIQGATFEARMPVISYRVARPTLEDVFLRLVEG
jgi:ABC-2 type transport system ATP-binding protein